MASVRVGFNLPGTMMRLGLHTGAMLGWVFYGLPIPVLTIGTSVGALILACMISFDKKEMHRMASLVGNLKREQIYTTSKGLWRTGAHLLAAGAVLILSAATAGSLGEWWAALLILLAGSYAYARFRGTRIQYLILRGLLLIAALAAGKLVAWFPAIVFWSGLFTFDCLVRRALHIFFRECESPLDTMPLFKFLRGKLSFSRLFGAATELQIITTGIAAPRMVAFSNHDVGKNDPGNPIHCDRFVDIIRASTALPGRFPLIYVDGECLRDAEIWTAFPVELFKGKVDIIFRFDYWEPLEPEHAPNIWFEDLFRSFDVMRDRATCEATARYEHQCAVDPSLPRVVHIRMSEKLKQQVPVLAVHTFKPGQLWQAIRLGYRIIRENLPMIRHELGRL